MSDKTPNPVTCSWKSQLNDRELTKQEKLIDQAIDNMDDLCNKLDKLGYKYERHGPEVITEPYLMGSILKENQVIFYDGDKEIGDAICQESSYGYESGLFEVMGSPLLRDPVTDDVQGWVTEDEIIERLGEYYASKQENSDK